MVTTDQNIMKLHTSQTEHLTWDRHPQNSHREQIMPFITHRRKNVTKCRQTRRRQAACHENKTEV